MCDGFAVLPVMPRADVLDKTQWLKLIRNQDYYIIIYRFSEF